MRVLDLDEQRKLVSAAHLAAFGIVLTLFTGIRLGEMLGLQWRAVNFENAQINIRRTLSRLMTFGETSEFKAANHIGKTKTINSAREVYLIDNLLTDLIKYKNKLIEYKRLSGVKHEETDHVFVTPELTPIDPKTYQDLFKRTLKQGGVADANFHSLRHTFATRSLEQ